MQMEGCGGMGESLKEYCIRYDRRELLAQWHPDKNGELDPEDVLPESHCSVGWRCEEGHAWRAMVSSRINGTGCPVCAGRVVLSGENDLETVYSALAAQWHPEKNGTLRPSQVVGGSTRRVWWRCDQGHVWQASIKSRTQGAGCPVCAGKIVNPGENDLKSCFPELAEQWDWDKNGILGPDQVLAFSNRRVWWRCGRGHTWKAKISDRATRRSECPYCTNRKVLEGFNDLKTVEPLVAAQWHPDRNVPLEPGMVLPGSTKRVWWRCGEGHEWKAVIYSRTGTQKCGCPVCAGKRPRTYR